jgi:hypothetical protein
MENIRCRLRADLEKRKGDYKETIQARDAIKFMDRLAKNMKSHVNIVSFAEIKYLEKWEISSDILQFLGY